jgi:hypothetical protein
MRRETLNTILVVLPDMADEIPDDIWRKWVLKVVLVFGVA